MLWNITYSFRDADGNLGRCSITSAATTVAALVAQANAVAVAIQTISNAALTGANISHHRKLTPSAPVPGCTVGRKGLLLARQTSPEVYGSLVIPGVRYDLLTGAREGLRYARKAEASPSLAAAINAILATGPVNPYRVQFPVADWVLAGMQDE